MHSEIWVAFGHVGSGQQLEWLSHALLAVVSSKVQCTVNSVQCIVYSI